MITCIVKSLRNCIYNNTAHAQSFLKKIVTNIACALIFSCIIALPAAAQQHKLNDQQYKIGDIEILHPWMRATPQGIKVSSGYLYIINHSSTPDRLVSVSTDGVQTTEIHSMSVVNDIMKMEKMHNGVEIPGNGEVTLKPGGNHIMFMGLSQPFKPGDKINAKLTFEKAGTVDINFSVKAIGDASPVKSTPVQ
ncbi:copper chaperone PCu(A)C [Bartonella raoultii]|uniref:Copper chaperone PCu(A)C n=1 Tax=Bartonella raoultii TaxID=1457020 RepID=A0ABS7I9V0_9HYPH|nr:copper chaperone PCu(A)C [Bartonella raoultii]MBX4335330.1 copper chaperone PCu(A)C [Bartonella raoultii]